MEITGEYRIAAPRQAVWEALNDPEVLRQCIPGCETLERVSDTEMTARVTAKIGPVTAKFTGGVTLSEIAAPDSYRISGEGKGGVAGFAKGSARVTLSESDGATLLHYDADAQVGGKLAQLGTRLVGGTARKMADDFFDRFSQLVAPAAPEIETVVVDEAERVEIGRTAPVAGAPAQPPAAGAEAEPDAARTMPDDAALEPTRSEGPMGISPKLWILGIILLAFGLIWAFA
jgi:hypothetical protein